MGRIGRMEELQNLAVFLISGGCDWINGETIAMDGGQALAMGGNFYQLRDWTDANRFGNVTTQMFVEAASRAAGADVGPLLNEWLYETELPKLPPAR